MTERTFFLKVGDGAPRGPLAESAIRDALRTGVVPEDALVGPTADGPFILASVELAPTPRKKSFLRFVVPAVAVLLVLAAGAGGIAYYVRSRPPTLCAATPKLLASLENNLQIDAYVTRGSPKLDTFARDLDKLLRAYKSAGHGRMDYRIIEATTEEQKKEAKEAGLVEQPFGEGDVVHVGYEGLVFKYGAEKETIKFLGADIDGLEFWITNKIREVRARAGGATYKLGAATGAGEIALSEPNLVPRAAGTPSLQVVITQYFPFYSFTNVDLSKPIDPALRGIILTQPDRDLTQAELEALDAFVMQGKALAIFASAVNVKPNDATMHAQLSTHGLERLLAGYGVTMHADLVLESASSYDTKVMTAGGATALRVPSIPIVRAGAEKGAEGGLDDRSAVFFRLQEAAFPFASSLVVDATKQPGAAFRVLARTTSSSTTLTEGTPSLNPVQKPRAGSSPAAAQTIALSVEGRLTSAFGKGTSTGPARVLVVASSQFLANPFARAGNPSAAGAGTAAELMMPSGGDEQLVLLAAPYAQSEITSTILVFKNTLDWLAMDDDLAECTLPVKVDKSRH